jgi:phospholipid/cholesterol/gamma-HCH transport system substrate-binding protein
MVQVRGFVKENRGSLTRNIAGLNRVSKVLVKRRDVLDQTLRYAPAALNNLYLAGNQKQGTLDTRDNAGQLASALQEDPAAALCSLVGPAVDCGVFGDALAPRPGALTADTAAKPRVPEPVDRSLGGIVEVAR